MAAAMIGISAGRKPPFSERRPRRPFEEEAHPARRRRSPRAPPVSGTACAVVPVLVSRAVAEEPLLAAALGDWLSVVEV